MPTFDFQTPPVNHSNSVGRADDLHGRSPSDGASSDTGVGTEKVVSRAAFILLYPAPRGPTTPRLADSRILP